MELKIRSWLTTRNAVEIIRRLRKPLPWIFRHDVIRLLSVVSLILLVLASAGVMKESSYQDLANWMLLFVFLLVPAYVIVTSEVFPRKPGVTPKLLANLSSGCRPNFLLRIVAVSVVTLTFLFTTMIWKIAANTGPGLAITVVLISIPVTYFYWRLSCAEALGFLDTLSPVRSVVNRRAATITALHLEETLAVVMIVDLLVGQEIYSTLSDANQMTMNTQFQFGIEIPRKLSIQPNGWPNIEFHPFFILLWAPTSAALSVVLYFLRQRPIN